MIGIGVGIFGANTARENSMFSPDAFDVTSNWSAFNSAYVVANTDNNPFDGSQTADTLVDSTAGFGRIQQNVTLPQPYTSGFYSFSVFFEKTVGATSAPLFQMGFNNGGANYGAELNTDNGSMAVYAFGVATAVFASQDYGSFWRVFVSGTNNGSGDVALCSIFPSINSTANGQQNGAVQGSVVAWGAQFTGGVGFKPYYAP